MARKDDLRALADQWAGGVDSEASAVPAGLALHRRAGAAGELIAMSADGKAWRVPDQAGGWSARVELPDVVDARGLKRLGADAERKALARIGAGAVIAEAPTPDQVQAADVQVPIAEAPATAGPAPTPTPTAPTAADQAGRRVPVTVYLDAAEHDALAALARAEDRPVSYVVRRAIRQALGLA